MSEPIQRPQLPERAIDDARQLEQQLLGGLIRNGMKGLDAAVAAGLQPTDFQHAQHGDLFASFLEAGEDGMRPNGPVMFARVRNQPELGGVRYWTQIYEASAGVGWKDCGGLARSVIEARCRREGWAELVETMADLEGMKLDPTDTLQRLALRLQDITSGAGVSGPAMLSELLGGVLAASEAAYKGEGAPATIPTGFKALDAMLGGMEPGGMYVLGARPSMGKTALATCIALNVAASGKRVALFSLEMTKSEMSLRMLSNETRIPMHSIRYGRLQASDWTEKLTPARGYLQGLPISIDDRASLTMGEIEATCRHLGPDLGLVIVDHLGLVGSPDEFSRAGLVERTAAVSNGCKRMAKRLGVPVLICAQLNRANEQRDDKRPQLSELRWAGEIEQDADAVILLHREEYYAERKPDAEEAEVARVRGLAQVFVAKNRNGSVGQVELGFMSTAARFFTIDKGADHV